MTGRRELTVNIGSSSAKLRVLDDREQVIGSHDLTFGGTADVPAVVEAVTSLGPVDVVIHRVVHGGPRYRSATVIDDDVLTELRSLEGLAPLHQSSALAAIDALREAVPVRHVACFDTAFHATLPPEAATYAVPLDWRTEFGIRRYGFHGLSHSYASTRAAQMLRKPVGDLRIVVCHLGSGASLCAVRSGVSVDTTMGFTPLEGLVMATRSGSVDPGAMLWMLAHGGLSAPQMLDALEHRSGLLALAGTADMRGVVAGVDAGDERCALAFDVYIHRLVGQIAAMAAATNGIDALVFTGGVGEHAPAVRSAVAARSGFLGVHVDEAANHGVDGDASITAPGSRAAMLVVEAREDLAMVRAAAALCGEHGD